MCPEKTYSMNNQLNARALRRAAELKGGDEQLAAFLGVSHETLLLWLKGKASMPGQYFDKVLDVLLDGDVASLTGAGRLPLKDGSRVLVVDDDPGGAYGLARVLRQIGHSVETVTDGPSAIEAARRMRPDVIFVDLRMPGMDGVEVARALKAEGLGVHIVAASAYPSELQQPRTAAAGFSAHLVKPVEAASIEKLLTELQ